MTGDVDITIITVPVNGVDCEKESFLEQLKLDLNLHEPVDQHRAHLLIGGAASQIVGGDGRALLQLLQVHVGLQGVL